VSLRMPVRALVRMLVALTLAVTAGATAAAVAPATALASGYDLEAQFVADMNAARQAGGLAPYSVAYDLVAVARGHSQRMASQQSLYHNPGLTTEVHSWQAVGENVGEGPTVSDIHTAFMNSPEHRANILDHDFTQVGVGVTVDSHGIIWVTEDFRQPMGSAPAATPQSHPSHTSSHASAASSGTASTGAVPTAAAPRPAPSPRAVLLHRLHELRHDRHAARTAGDPVAQAFAYADALATLTR